MENKVLPKSIRIGNTSSLDKKRRVNTSAGCYLVRKGKEGGIELLVIKKEWPDGTEKYVLPKGHKEGEEVLEETALRETMEESGYVDITLLRYLGSGTYEIDWKEIQMKTDHYFLAILNSDKQDGKTEETYEEGVVVENEWIELEKGLGLLTYENNPEIHVVLRDCLKEDVIKREI
jgi:8-oxo-dGTP pyrophosphatase MutT (NUDIX family)